MLILRAISSSLLLSLGAVACSGETVGVPDASGDGSGGDGGLACVGGTISCGDKCIAPELDPKNCGGCGKQCAAGEMCSAGMCATYCQTGYMPCSGGGADGGPSGPYCANLNSDPNNCGACGNVCSNNHGIPSCTNGTCATTCLGTYVDCDKNPATGCEVDLATDPKSCGKCGHDCLGGTCAGSLCQPVVLASGQGSPYALTIDGTNVYWTTAFNGAVRLCAKGGCNNTPTTLATNQQYPYYGIAVDGTNVYWTNYTAGQIQKCAISGCSGNPTTLVSGQANAAGLAVDSTSVYWSIYANGGPIQKCATGGCSNTPTTLASGQNFAYQVAVDATNVYWTGGTLRKCAVGGCSNTPTTLLNNIGWGGIALDSSNVYVTGNGILKCAIAGCSMNPTTLATGFAFGIAVDTADAYWASPSSGTVSRCAVGGCNSNPTLLAFAQGTPEGIAVDATAIYWTNYNQGTVVKLAK